ncbi:unnamed protein product, partial [Diamesa tonsa]
TLTTTQSTTNSQPQSTSMNSLRPDTPLTLGDDAPEFKHHIDLTPCPSSNLNSQHEYMGDHSYTRPKNSHYDMHLLGVQTPSDSEEEIDVVSIGEKTLPTNPSARDRRALQTTVAHKIARMGKNSSNHQRRLTGSSGVSRKRSHNSKDNNNNDSHESSHHSKKYRSQNTKKQQRLSNAKAAAAAAAAAANKIEDTDEAETIEKRNLHNNMERQRRIGLKNLFEELKCQIPSLKDKERAPKVNILREAAAFCNKLKRDDDLHNELSKKQNRLMARVRSLKASIATSQRKNY